MSKFGIPESDTGYWELIIVQESTSQKQPQLKELRDGTLDVFYSFPSFIELAISSLPDPCCTGMEITFVPGYKDKHAQSSLQIY